MGGVYTAEARGFTPQSKASLLHAVQAMASAGCVCYAFWGEWDEGFSGGAKLPVNAKSNY